jgi:hypothetical protein
MPDDACSGGDVGSASGELTAAIALLAGVAVCRCTAASPGVLSPMRAAAAADHCTSCAHHVTCDIWSWQWHDLAHAVGLSKFNAA